MGDKRVTVLALVKAEEGMEEAIREEPFSLVKPTRAEGRVHQLPPAPGNS